MTEQIINPITISTNDKRDYYDKLIHKFGREYIFEDAASRGYMDIVNIMIEKGADDWNGGLRYALHPLCYSWWSKSKSYSNQVDIIILMIKKGADDWNKFNPTTEEDLMKLNRIGFSTKVNKDTKDKWDSIKGYHIKNIIENMRKYEEDKRRSLIILKRTVIPQDMINDISEYI